VGDPVYRTGNPLSVELGPGKTLLSLGFASLILLFINYCLGILNTIFDGIQRPLKTIADMSKSVFVPRGVDVPCLDQHKAWDWTPGDVFKAGDNVTAGDVLGFVFENDLFAEHRIMVPPKIYGRIKEVMPRGQYSVNQPVVVVEFEGKEKEINMSHFWPVRQARPTAEKLAGKIPLLTGQRVLDTLFPTVQGGTCAIPGAFGCGKTCISQAISKHSNS